MTPRGGAAVPKKQGTKRPTLALCAASTSWCWSGRACALMAEMTTSKPGNSFARSSTGDFTSQVTTLTPRSRSSLLLVLEREDPRVIAVISYSALVVRNSFPRGGVRGNWGSYGG